MDFMTYISQNALILIPALYIVGMVIRGTESIPNKFIPFILLIIGIVGAMLLLGFNINGAIQGILVTGVTVYTNQLFKQYNKNE
ncbi:UNVERIFIED_ORG: holin [Clostridium botulinum]|uniref:phage holin family protein n=1 Tax=Clostridium botulinum TaxID=1491 RepID=UPI000773ABFE|nr:phage holin family protein [Clostridium botulinum]MBN1071465.1 holin [Clostridium botulinum]MBY6809620.1 phage holin family protein [Clostridium botulinum]MBY6823062.1 phage holin family protein [Clostridium botulinum]MBY6833674.1 phage holin family protein [Clostridium botulinum]MBY6930937.1 phage holin family protein [Clostridium botulinum]